MIKLGYNSFMKNLFSLRKYNGDLSDPDPSDLMPGEHFLKVRIDPKYFFGTQTTDHVGHTDYYIGFVAPVTKAGSVTKDFNYWEANIRSGYGASTKMAPNPIFILNEVPRNGWRLYGLRSGMSTAWGRFQHPIGFIIEINETSFQKLIPKITIKNCEIQEKLQFVPKSRGTELLVF